MAVTARAEPALVEDNESRLVLFRRCAPRQRWPLARRLGLAVVQSPWGAVEQVSEVALMALGRPSMLKSAYALL